MSADHSDIASLQQQLYDQALKLAAMTGRVAKARQVLYWQSERRKVALARLVTAYLEQDESAVAAENKARAHPDYKEQMARMFSQCLDAEQAIAEWDATKTLWESCRSLVSLEKAVIGNV